MFPKPISVFNKAPVEFGGNRKGRSNKSNYTGENIGCPWWALPVCLKCVVITYMEIC